MTSVGPSIQGNGDRCPACGRWNDHAAMVNQQQPVMPNAGDLSVCIGCAAINVFTGYGLEVRSPTTDELGHALTLQSVADVVFAIRAAPDL